MQKLTLFNFLLVPFFLSILLSSTSLISMNSDTALTINTKNSASFPEQSLALPDALIKALYEHGTYICFSRNEDATIMRALHALNSELRLPDLKNNPSIEDFCLATDICHWLHTNYDQLEQLTASPEKLKQAFLDRSLIPFKGVTKACNDSLQAAQAACLESTTEALESITEKNEYREIFNGMLPQELGRSLLSNTSLPHNSSSQAVQVECADTATCFVLRELLIRAANAAPYADPTCGDLVYKVGIFGIPVIFPRATNFPKTSFLKSTLQERLFNVLQYYAGHASFNIVNILEIAHEWRRYDLVQAAFQFMTVHALEEDTTMPIHEVNSILQKEKHVKAEKDIVVFAQHLPYHYFDTLSFYPECAPFYSNVFL